MQEPLARDVESVCEYDDYTEEPKGCLYRHLAADKQHMARTVLEPFQFRKMDVFSLESSLQTLWPRNRFHNS